MADDREQPQRVQYSRELDLRDKQGNPVTLTVLTVRQSDGSWLGWYPINQLCAGLWIQAANQRQQLQAHRALRETIDQQPIKTRGGEQKVWCINEDGVPGWLFTLSLDKVNPEAADRLLWLQRTILGLARLALASPQVGSDLAALEGWVEGRVERQIMRAQPSPEQRFSTIERALGDFHGRLSHAEVDIQQLRTERDDDTEEEDK